MSNGAPHGAPLLILAPPLFQRGGQEGFAGRTRATQQIMTTLYNDLATLDKTVGIESMCVAGGMGAAGLFEVY